MKSLFEVGQASLAAPGMGPILAFVFAADGVDMAQTLRVCKAFVSAP